MPGKKNKSVDIEDEPVENTYVKEEDSDVEEEEDDMSDAGDDAEEVEGFKMPNIFDTLGFDFGDWGGIVTMVVMAILAIIFFAQFMDIDLFDMPSLLGGEGDVVAEGGNVAAE